MTKMSDRVPVQTDPGAFCRAKDCAEHFGIGISTWWHWVATGKAKRPIKLGPKTSVWRTDYIRELENQFIQDSNQAEDE